MISKLDGQARIDKLRTIHGYEADYNGLLKIEWPKRAVHHATKKDLLNHSQGGGGTKKEAGEPYSAPKRNKIHVRTIKKSQHGHDGQ